MTKQHQPNPDLANRTVQGWFVIEATDFESIRSAILTASCTGSTGATHRTTNAEGDILKSATVTRINGVLLMDRIIHNPLATRESHE